MLENKKNVLFDMDGLLIDSEALGIKMWEKVFAQHNEPFNPEAAYKTIGSNGLAAQEMLEKITGNDTTLHVLEMTRSKKQENT